MLTAFELRPHERRVEVTHAPDATAADRRQTVLDLLDLLTVHPGFGVLVDMRAPTQVLSYEDARQIIDTVVAHAETFRGGIALLAVAGVSYGVARVQQAIGDTYGVPLMVFTDHASAIAWLEGPRA